ncbi:MULTISPECIES: MATE family efflux transporter [Butyricimonas]|uniref:MATE family efflux transporter n=1 Tax=Butyricimonas TaxID=574697 RepID=UPI001D0729F6|nr:MULTISPECIES: MATE family efflux transporter [Butyricimonas]MCB6973540.1 MATE family efflux transporter [Butyricimonas synergistica]MCG4520356.1 MATE family efflux transporter [Butyricimonas sp. DFI.6.44]
MAIGIKKEVRDLTAGNISLGLLWFAVPMILGNLLQQLYNIADTLIVGQFLGANALAAVGSAYALMIFLTSVLLGLCMGSGVVFSLQYGSGNKEAMKRSAFVALVLIGAVTLLLNIIAFVWIDPIMRLLQVPEDVYPLMREYLWIIFWGIGFTFIYNYYACLLRAIGNSVVPLWFLAVAVVLNIVLDLLFILLFGWGVRGAAWATVVAQAVSGVGLCLYAIKKFPEFRIRRQDMRMKWATVKEIAVYSSLTCVQQSVMNFGILMVQGLINSFGIAVMAAFAAAVKIDSFAYMPVQDFGNAFSTFIAQNFGAGKTKRIREGIRVAVISTMLFCLFISLLVFIFARPLMLIFVPATESEIIAIGVQYLRVEGAFYCGIGCLFLLYGFYRGIRKPGMSVVLTVISLGTRVVLAYVLSAIPAIGVVGIWWAVPVGWFLADIVGMWYYRKCFHLKFRDVSLE